MLHDQRVRDLLSSGIVDINKSRRLDGRQNELPLGVTKKDEWIILK
jgi:hypothetical protein